MANRIKTQVKELFILNKELQVQNYYMAEFEFKMLGLSYLLDRGHYYSAVSKLNELHHQLKTKIGLVKLPEFKNKKEELEFYLGLQNPKTGAFMDDSYPLNTYLEPTANVLLHLDALATETGQPLRLKYPLKFLDEINTTEKLLTVLNDWSVAGWFALKFPQTSFHNVRDLLKLAIDYKNYDENQVDMVIQKHHLYPFSSEWKHAMLQWFYDYQDPRTGLWGPKSKTGKLVKKDPSNTASILKAFVDGEGNNIHGDFPLRYKDELFETILQTLDREPPKDDELDRWHEWGLETPKGLRILTRYLWKGASQENINRARSLMEAYVKTAFKKLYIPEEGAFSYYPKSKDATLDGTVSGLLPFMEFGAFSVEKQTRLWGAPQENIKKSNTLQVSELNRDDFNIILNRTAINSLRVYQTKPDYKNLAKNVFAVIYSDEIQGLDILDLIPKIKAWVNTTDQTMGNWVSKEEIDKQLKAININQVPVYKRIPFEILNQKLQEDGKLIMIGFDILQVPRNKMTFEFKK